MSKLEELKKIEIQGIKPVDTNVYLQNVGVYNKYLLSVKELKFNPFNDRFAAEIYEYEKQKNCKLGFDLDSQQTLRNWLINENPKDRKILKNSIEKDGLIDPIVIESRGIVINGNRRLMVLKDILEECENDLTTLQNKSLYDKFQKIQVVLVDQPEDMTEKKIRELETALNTAVITHLSYGAINHYLKLFRLFNSLENAKPSVKFARIASLMGESKYSAKKIERDYYVFETMRDYLVSMNWEHYYTLLKKRGDHFEKTRAFFDGLVAGAIDVDYDLNDFSYWKKVKLMIYYLISIFWEGKKFRTLLPSKNKQALFSSKKKIDSLYTVMENINLPEYCFAHPSQPLNNSEDLEILASKIEELKPLDGEGISASKILSKMETQVVQLKKQKLNVSFQERLKVIANSIKQIIEEN